MNYLYIYLNRLRFFIKVPVTFISQITSFWFVNSVCTNKNVPTAFERQSKQSYSDVAVDVGIFCTEFTVLQFF